MSARRLKSWVLLFCAATLLLAQFTGAHYHRHIGPSVDESGASVHLLDAGVHIATDLNHHDHHAASDHAAHPGVDLEIDSSVATFAKFVKWALPSGLLLAVVLWRLQPLRGARLPRIAAAPVRLRPPLFSLCPPSHAPPFGLSRV